ncbi:MAG: acetolactate synthase small subunit [Ignavibacteriaceae bacterium]|jgi:acetolactate synthase I/III small subunit
MKEQFTISVFTENHIGILTHISIIFTRRHINIDSITASETEAQGIYRYTIVVTETRDMVRKVVKQIEKIIEVFQAYYHTTKEIIHQEIALYKLPIKAIAQGAELEKVLRQHNARILTVETEFLIVEKSGHKEETQVLLEQLEPYGVIEFVRSGRVAIIKPMWRFNEGLHEMEKNPEVTLA